MAASNFEKTANKVYCLAGTALLLAFIQIVLEIISYTKQGQFNRLPLAVVFLAIAILIPWCGWTGARDKDGQKLCCFAVWNYISGCSDCIFACVVMGAVAAFVSLSKLAEHCRPMNGFEDPDSCTPERRQQLHRVCSTISEAFKNVSETNPNVQWNTTEIDMKLSEQECMDTLAMYGGVLAFLMSRTAGLGGHHRLHSWVSRHRNEMPT